MDMTLARSPVGQLLDGRYRVESHIAHGGMASVYLGVDTRLDRTVALKVMHAELANDEDFVRRFVTEARSVARLSHPNVVTVFDQGADGRTLYLAMEYVPGRTLRDLLRERGRLGPREALDVMDGMLAGLAAAHEAGLAHRDVKPENVLLSDSHAVKVADFGLARLLAAASHTKSGMIIGTAAYLAPEQVSGGTADARTDVYAAGVMLFELLTGRQPHTGDTPLAVAYKHVNEVVPPPSSLVPGLPPALDALVALATSRDPDLRPADAGQFLGAITGVRHGLPLSDASAGLPLSDASAGLPPGAVTPPAAAPGPVPGLGSTAAYGATPPSGNQGWAGGNTPPAGVAVPPLPWPGAAAAQPGDGPVPPPPGDALVPRTGPARPGADLIPGMSSPAPARNDHWIPGMAAPPPEDDFGPGMAPPRARQTFGAPHGPLDASATQRFEDEPHRGAQHTLIVAGGGGGYGPPPARYHGRRESGLFSRRTAYVAIGLAVVLVIGAITWWQMTGRYITVPSLNGMSVAEARAELRDVGLAVATGKPQLDNQVGKGQVIRTQPANGARIAKGGKVTLFVSAGPHMITVPEVTGQALADAQAALQHAGLVPGQPRPETSATIPAGIVISTTPAAGVSWPQPRPVGLVVSAGLPFPDFVGQDKGVAEQWAAANGISLNEVPVDSSSQAAGTVIHQSLKPGSAFTKGQVVTIKISNGPPMVNVPDVRGMKPDKAAQVLEKAGFTVTETKVGPFNEVFDYNPKGQAPKGSTITIDVGLPAIGG